MKNYTTPEIELIKAESLSALVVSSIGDVDINVNDDFF
jgi:hypothetical protein